MNSVERAKLEARKALYETQLAAANDTLDELIGEKYSMTELDTSEGDQKLVTRKIADAQQTIDWLEGKIDRACMRLNNTGIVRMRMRRKPS